jgi:hypothetical protein
MHCCLVSEGIQKEDPDATGCSDSHYRVLTLLDPSMGSIPRNVTGVLHDRHILHKSTHLLLKLTQFKHDIKDRLVLTSTNTKKGSEPVTRTHVQVLANSLAGTILTVIHFHLTRGTQCFSPIPAPHTLRIRFISDVLVYGIIG